MVQGEGAEQRSSLTEPQDPVGDLHVPAAPITSVDAEADADAILATVAERERNRLPGRRP
ncbi:hypothetical protein AQI88_41155 [Streptomyces cellostaticus]|uniref:Uncharacterized protein n=1 Tax=Streptomyces cellostaticus TaxID=67285 RepID=A0A124HA10_9ACTN|nr:hypothetical protein AQI88_41155 [Streptomyces cellostaticus]GHI09472.1 hypothetical protein Scel_77930 [Streptomyces cellostaticus]